LLSIWLLQGAVVVVVTVAEVEVQVVYLLGTLVLHLALLTQ
jgi:hypothetical protein